MPASYSVEYEGHTVEVIPDIELPGWIQAVLESTQYWLPIVVGPVLASRELKRRKRARRG